MNTFQDYLGAIIVSSAIFIMLISAKLYPHITPALVGLAINYTLLVPIYLNWVVKFIAETEIYFGSVARISTYRYAPVENYQDGTTLSLKYKFQVEKQDKNDKLFDLYNIFQAFIYLKIGRTKVKLFLKMFL